MSKDYKKSERKPGSRGSGGSLLVGILIGLVLGLTIALAVAWYINKTPSPFLSRSVPGKAAKAEGKEAIAGEDRLSKAAGESKTRFDFYKILPGNEEPGARPAEPAKASAVAARETFFLQAGSFQNAPDADNLKARLALIGFEATVQAAAVADKGVWHRVRVGPYASIEELNRTREVLKQNGYETTLVKADAERPR